MIPPTPEERRQLFSETLTRIVAIDLPKQWDKPQVIYFLYGIESDLLASVYYLQSYNDVGFTLIMEKINEDIISLKIHEPTTDHFYICPKVVTKTGAFDLYKMLYTKGVDTFLSVGIIYRGAKLDHVNTLRIAIKGVVFS